MLGESRALSDQHDGGVRFERCRGVDGNEDLPPRRAAREDRHCAGGQGEQLLFAIRDVLRRISPALVIVPFAIVFYLAGFRIPGAFGLTLLSATLDKRARRLAIGQAA